MKILDSFVLSESKTLLSTSNVFRHWHDLTGFPVQLKKDLIRKDRLCSPSLCYGNYHSSNVPSSLSLFALLTPLQTLNREQKIQRLSGWMELEGPRFFSDSHKVVSSIHREYFATSQSSSTLRTETMRITEDGNEEEDIAEENSSTLATTGESPNEIYILHAHTQSSTSHPPPVDPRTLRQSHNDPDDHPMKLALDDDTPLTRTRSSIQKFRIAYSPQMISRLVLESIESLLGESPRTRRKKWHRKVASMFRSIFCSSSNPPTRSDPSSFGCSTDWLLHRLYLAVSGGSPASSVVKWYATFITDTKATPIESRLLVVATCFDISGSIARVSGITSSKSAFRVFENS